MKHYVTIYKHKTHLLLTLLVVMLPFLFVLLFGELGFSTKFDFLGDLLLSTVRLTVAFAVSVFVAIILGVLLSEGRVGNFFLPLFDVLQSFPTFAMLPLAVYWFGASDMTVILFLVVTMIWPILFAIISSQKLIKTEWEEAATIFGARGWKRTLYFSLPISYPGLVTGSIVGLGEAWEAVVGAEIIIGLKEGGLGGFFSRQGTSGAGVFFGVTALLLFIFALNKLLFLPLLERSHKVMTD